MHSSQTAESVQAARAHVIRAVAKSSAEEHSCPNGATGPNGTPVMAPRLADATPVIGLIDLDHIARAYDQLTAAFAGKTEVLHAVACKAVPLQPLLRYYAESGAGCEVASPGELELALSAGFAPEAIVFDSPAKTLSELRRAVALGVSMNIDNFDELERLDAILADLASFESEEGAACEDDAGREEDTACEDGAGREEDTACEDGAGREDGANPSIASGSGATSARVGIRINPQSGTGTIGALSTATQTSKFGIGLADPGARESLIAAYLERPWLNQIHVHSGSQGISLEQAAAGVEAVVALACEINERASRAHGRARQITRIDIGGGLPVNFAGEDITPTFAEYRAVLEAQVPDLFDFDIITEFGRALLAKAGTTLTRVEYAKTTGGRRIAMTHAGVQVATRTAYAPDDWPLRILPFNSDGSPKTAEAVPTDVAGPACFAGDLLARDRMLPRLDAGDIVAVPDTGAYYFSNPFSYNLLPRVPVYGYRTDPGAVEYSLIRRGQSPEELLAEAGEAEISPYCAVQIEGDS